MRAAGGVLWFRVDGGPAIGAGHLMRCLALAQGWADAGGRATFLTATAAPAIEDRLRHEGVDVLRLDAMAGSEEDAARTAALARAGLATWVVVDGYHFGADYQRRIKEAGHRLLFLDDYGHADHYHADLVLNQNAYADESLYPSREPHTRCLTGSRYVLLRREFREAADARPTPETARRVLVTLGGADPDNVTLKAVEALGATALDGLEAVVVIGGANPHGGVIRAAARAARVPVRFVENTEDMAGLMARADIAVAAGGTTSWELAHLGLPSLLFVLAANQERVAQRLAELGVAVNLGHPDARSAERLARELEGLARSPDRRAEMAARGRALVDGRGVARVVRLLCAGDLRLRPATEEDCRLIWEWANDPETRGVSFSSAPIPWERHVDWFRARMRDPNTAFFVATDGSGTPVGQVRFQVERQEALISVALDRRARGKGYGSTMIRLAAEELFDVYDVGAIHAYIKPGNEASRRAFARAGFTEQAATTVQGQPATHMILRGGDR